MVCQKLDYNLNKLLVSKKWLYAFLKLYIQKGYKNKAYSWLKLLVLKLNKLIPHNLENFFNVIEKRFPLQITLRKRVVAGKVVKIPVFLANEKKIWYNVRFIFQFLKEKSEITFLDKLINELVLIYQNKGLILKKYLTFQKDIKLLLPNNRFLDR